MKPAPRVLIVDDEESIRTFAERVLHLAGYETAVAADGPEALRIAEAQAPFDLLLADVFMPAMHGDELARRLLRLEPDLKVLYFTGYSDQLFAERTTLGANEAFIDKPVTMKGLVEAVSLMLSGHTHRLGREILADLARLRSFRRGDHRTSRPYRRNHRSAREHQRDRCACATTSHPAVRPRMANAHRDRATARGTAGACGPFTRGIGFLA